MMPELHNEPIICRVLGFGNETAATIDGISRLGVEGLEASVVSDDADTLTVTDDDIFIILLASGDSERLRDIAGRFSNVPGLLTVCILTDPATSIADLPVPFTVVEPAKATEAIKSLTDIIFINCYIALDLTDFRTTFLGATRFSTVTVEADGNDSMKKCAETILDSLTRQQRQKVTRAILGVYTNPDSDKPIALHEVKYLTELVNNFSDEIDLLWGVYLDPSLQSDTIRLTFISVSC